MATKPLSFKKFVKLVGVNPKAPPKEDPIEKEDNHITLGSLQEVSNAMMELPVRRVGAQGNYYDRLMLDQLRQDSEARIFLNANPELARSHWSRSSLLRREGTTDPLAQEHELDAMRYATIPLREDEVPPGLMFNPDNARLDELSARMDGTATMAEVHQLREQAMRDQERIARLEDQLYEIANNNPTVAIIDPDLR